LTGAVYSDHSGPSGRGTGDVVLATHGGLVRIHYQKPIKHKFSSDRCWQLGAIWTVWTRRGPNAEELIRAECGGAVDAAVNSGGRAVLDYIKSTARRAGYDLGFQPGRRRPVIVTMHAVDVDVSGYLNFPGSGMCLEVKERRNNSTVLIASSADCYFKPDIVFTAERVGASGWGVTSVKAVDTKHGTNGG
jgi:hypothetical protein